MKKVKNYFVKAIVGIVAFSTMLSGCAKTSTKSDDDHLTVFLWESKLVKNLAPYIRSQLPDMDIEFISGNNTKNTANYLILLVCVAFRVQIQKNYSLIYWI